MLQTQTQFKEVNMSQQNQQAPGQVGINLNLDTTPIFYTDTIYMTTNEDGLVLDVAQKIANTNQVRIVSRIGMSRNHAKKFIRELEKLMELTEGKMQTGDKGKN